MLLLRRVFITHCHLGMVIYCSLTLVVLTHCFARPTGGSLQLTIEELGEEADIKLLESLLGTLHTSCTNYYLHTDQLNIHYENGVTRSSYPPSVQLQHTLDQHSSLSV